jgi:hypothetical protein
MEIAIDLLNFLGKIPKVVKTMSFPEKKKKKDSV